MPRPLPKNMPKMLKKDLIEYIRLQNTHIKSMEKERRECNCPDNPHSKNKTKAEQKLAVDLRNNKASSSKVAKVKKVAKTKVSNKYDAKFFDRALAVLENYSIGKEEDEVAAKDLIKSLKNKPKSEVKKQLYEAILHNISEYSDTDDAEMDTGTILSEIFDDLVWPPLIGYAFDAEMCDGDVNNPDDWHPCL